MTDPNDPAYQVEEKNGTRFAHRVLTRRERFEVWARFIEAQLRAGLDIPLETLDARAARLVDLGAKRYDR